MLGVVATIKVKPGMEQQFEAVAKELVAKVTANEPGCRLYALHRAEAPLTYVFMERYTDQAAVEAHRPEAGELPDLEARRAAAHEGLARVSAAAYLDELVGTIGADPFHLQVPADR